ncbi:DMP19 family protein [Planctomicrobium sp. SH661]|uniref:DMP19 family protein n=1 Tax=Planctomicrobium sp. SH661 TaxID=3448124 RepID=UPI003F5C26E3
MIPRAITPDLLQNSPRVFQDLCLYVNETRNRLDRSALADYPSGLRHLLLVVDMDDAVHAGGLWGYLGDITNDDGTITEIDEVIRILKYVGANRIAAILEEALEVWKEFLASYLPARCRVNKKSFDEFQLSRVTRDSMERQLDPLDDEFYESHFELAETIGAYARAHANEFIHPAV